MIVVVCPGCQRRLRTRQTRPGATGKCPKCRTVVPIPVPSPVLTAPAAATGPAADTLPPLAGAAPTSDEMTAGGDPYPFLTPPQGPGELGGLGPYRVLRLLGHGTMGLVFAGEDPRLQRPVALKVLRPALAEDAEAQHRFQREARLTAAAEHDHVVTVYQVGVARGLPYLVLQLLTGESLEARLRRAGALPAREALRIGREAALGLAAIHRHGIVHRDVKPGNLWLEGRRARVKFLDFGLAAPAGPPARPAGAAAIRVSGTPAYMAPEQARGEHVDERADLFGLGCVLYRLCTGRAPFERPDVAATLAAVVADDPAPPLDRALGVSAPLSDLVMRLLAKSPADRPPSARIVAEALRRVGGKSS